MFFESTGDGAHFAGDIHERACWLAKHPCSLTDGNFLDIGVSTTTDNTPRPESNSALANSSTRTSSNPLASILGYEYAFKLLHVHLPRQHQAPFMTVAIKYVSCSNDDSASEDGSEPPSPRAITAAQAATSPDAAESITTNAEPGKDNAEEEDPMVNSKPGNRLNLRVTRISGSAALPICHYQTGIAESCMCIIANAGASEDRIILRRQHLL